MTEHAPETEQTTTVTEEQAEPAAEPSTPSSVTLSEEDAAALRSAHQTFLQEVTEGQRVLGARREQYVLEENAALQDIAKSRQTFETLVRQLADKNGVDITTGQWKLLLDKASFTKV